MGNKELHELCRGCKSYALIIQGAKQVFHRSCMIDIPIISSTDKCPCMTCLLKVMCGKICEDFVDFNMREAKARAMVGVLNDNK